MKEDNINKNYEWIDSLRVLATLSVIFIHVSAAILYQYGRISDFDWWVGNIFDGAARFCVPIFLMITGALIFSKTYESTREYLRKRVLRIVFPFLFWSMIYIAITVFLKFKHGKHFRVLEILEFVFTELKNGASFHLWYIYLVIGLYLFFPIIAKWINRSSKNELHYFIGIWLLTIVFQLPYVNELVPNIALTYFSGYIGFPILGYYLSNYTFDFNRKKVVYVAMILTGTLITILGTFLISKYQNHFNELFYQYLSLNVLLVSIGIFLFFKDFIKLGTKTTNYMFFFSKYSYGIYLIHIWVLMILDNFSISGTFVNPIIGIPLTSVLGFVISAFIVFGINKLPYGKYISG